MLVIHEPPVQFQANSTLKHTARLTSCCCNSCIANCCCCGPEGTTDLTVNFDKNVFYSNEVANAVVAVDNTNQHLRIREVEFQVTQRINLPGRTFTFDLIENKDRSGIDPNQAEIVKQMQLNL